MNIYLYNPLIIELEIYLCKTLYCMECSNNLKIKNYIGNKLENYIAIKENLNKLDQH